MAIDAEMEFSSDGGLSWLIGYLVWYGMIAVFVWIAIQNLIQAPSMPLLTTAASLIILAFIPFFTVYMIRQEGGLSLYLINRLGELCSTHFLSIEHDDIDVQRVCVGYRLYNRRFYFRRIPLAQIVCVRWDRGQASSLTGRELDDWSLCLVHLTNQVNTVSKLSQYITGRCEDLISFGPGGKKETVDLFAQSVVKFLCNHGVQLVPTDDEREFVIPSLSHSARQAGR